MSSRKQRDLRESLIQTLKEFRGSIPPAMRAARVMPKAILEAREEVEKGLDELAALEDLYALQTQRMNIDGEVEKKIGKLIPTMTQEVRVAREILQTYADLKMDLGLSKRHLGRRNGHIPPGMCNSFRRPGKRKVADSLSAVTSHAGIVDPTGGSDDCRGQALR